MNISEAGLWERVPWACYWSNKQIEGGPSANYIFDFEDTDLVLSKSNDMVWIEFISFHKKYWIWEKMFEAGVYDF